MKRIGFIGLGVMGIPMVKNLLKEGYPVTIWNRTRSKMEELVSYGAVKAGSPKDVADHSDVLIIMVGDSSDVEEVVLGPSGIIETTNPNLIVIDMSSISPITTQQLAETLGKHKIQLLDAPVSGGDIGAKEARPFLLWLGDLMAYMRHVFPSFKC